MLLRISNRARSQCKSSVFISNNFTLFRTIDFDKHSIAIPNAIGEIQFQSGGKKFLSKRNQSNFGKMTFFPIRIRIFTSIEHELGSLFKYGILFRSLFEQRCFIGRNIYTCKKINGGNLIYIRIYWICIYVQWNNKIFVFLNYNLLNWKILE